LVEIYKRLEDRATFVFGKKSKPSGKGMQSSRDRRCETVLWARYWLRVWTW